jgi:hypothetical protein
MHMCTRNACHKREQKEDLFRWYFRLFIKMHCTQDINVLVLCIPLSLDLSEDGDLFAETFKRVQAYI